MIHRSSRHLIRLLAIALLVAGGSSCKKKFTTPEYDNPYDETSERYIPTPDLNTAPVTDIRALSATSGGQFQNDYGKPVTAKGVCWSLTANPTIEASCSSDGSATTNYASQLTGLRPDTVYYVRAFATNQAGTIYGGQRSFRTLDGKATFSGLAVSGVTSSGAVVAFKIDTDGGDPITARGVCWSNEPDPTLAGTCAASGTGTGTVSVTLTELARATAYYLRPYATNAAGTSYGAQASFMTLAVLPAVETGTVTEIGAASAIVAGTVTSDGGASQTVRGVCYATTQNPTTANTCVASGSGEGAFTTSLSGLSMGTVYYARAFATNAIGTVYGSQVSFTTLTGPTVSTGTVSSLSATGATVSGTVTADGGSPVTARGVCFAKTPSPTLENTCVDSGSGVGSFDVTLSGLQRGTTYYARPFATNGAATSYGADVSFTTLDAPTVTTGAVTNIATDGALMSGEVVSTGGASVTALGVCYATTPNPTISGTCTVAAHDQQSFEVRVSELFANNLYYVRAYATNSAGTAYGNQVTFRTLDSIDDIDGNRYPIVQIGTQRWMAANLKTTRYQNNATIDHVPNGATWAGLNTGAWANYDNDAANDATYGKLYNWYAVADSRNLCPVGWRVPTDNDWSILSSFLGTDAGFKMKSTSGWLNDGNGSNTTGFNGLPGGYRTNTVGSFGVVGRLGLFWSSSENNSDDAWLRSLSNGHRDLSRSNLPKNYGHSVRCVEGNPVANTPSVATGASVTAITTTSATVSGSVISDGGAAVTARGVCWSTSANPTTSGTCAASGSGTGGFTVTITGLTPNTSFFARAYATNSAGTGYGAQVLFTTSVTDIDGNVYPTVHIGTQVWMAANLKTTRYRDGTTIPNVTNGTTWSGLTTGAWANYDNNAANDATYGKLYNWYAVADSRNICPAGWHVPTDAEWTVLSNFLATDVGFKMKSTSGWDNNGNGSNASGFNGLPGGVRNPNGTFATVGRSGYFWSSSEFNSDYAWYRYLGSGNRDLGRVSNDKSFGFSVRCLRD
jgi:uncharacterized protein (TIGR02145 family)